MGDSLTSIANPPIVEAVIDIDCDLEPSLQFETLEGPAKSAFLKAYPIFELEQFFEHKAELQGAEGPTVHIRQGLKAYRFWHADRRQLVQVRPLGFSFNRLAPYTKLDDFLAEIERCWNVYTTLARPVAVRSIKLRYVNRLAIPATAALGAYLKAPPVVPATDLECRGFLHQLALAETGTPYHANVILASQPLEANSRPVILDITAAMATRAENVQDWNEISKVIQDLRRLKNRVFEGMVTEQCLTQYR